MKVQIISQTPKANINLLEWGYNNKKDCKIISENPVILEEEFKDSSVDWMIKEISKRLNIEIKIIKENQIYQNTLEKQLKKKVIKNLKLNKKDIKIKVI